VRGRKAATGFDGPFWAVPARTASSCIQVRRSYKVAALNVFEQIVSKRKGFGHEKDDDLNPTI
jgi:hypothetical protein